MFSHSVPSDLSFCHSAILSSCHSVISVFQFCLSVLSGLSPLSARTGSNFHADGCEREIMAMQVPGGVAEENGNSSSAPWKDLGEIRMRNIGIALRVSLRRRGTRSIEKSCVLSIISQVVVIIYLSCCDS